MNEFDDHYSRRDIGELPSEDDPTQELRRLVLRDGYLGDHEKSGQTEALLAKTPEELRQTAAEYDADADRLLEEEGNPRLYDRSREYARILIDLAEEREQGPPLELDPQEAVAKARAMYLDLLTESLPYQQNIPQVAGPFFKADDSEWIKMKINEHEVNASIPALLVAFLEKYPNLKETQKLGSLARNRLKAAQKARQDARSFAVEKPLGDSRDAKRKEMVEEDKRLEKDARSQFRIFKAAAKALRQGQVE